MIQVGGGLDATDQDKTINVLLRAHFEFRDSNGATTDRCIFARIGGDLALTQGAAGMPIPYIDAVFTPAQCPVSDDASVTRGGLVSGVTITVLPGGLKRDLRLDERVDARLSVIGIQVGATPLAQKTLGAYAQVATELLGYKLLMHASDKPDQNLLRFGSISAEMGAIVRISESFKVRVAMGAQADMSLARYTRVDGVAPLTVESSGTALRSEMGAFAQVSLDVSTFLEVFGRAAVNGVWTKSGDSDPDFRSYVQIMGGMTLLF
jgi:hypothetical protein